MNPVSDVKTAAKSAFTVPNILKGFFTLLAILAILDALGWTQKILFPVSEIKAWVKRKQANAA
jgi:hypothetical protein